MKHSFMKRSLTSGTVLAALLLAGAPAIQAQALHYLGTITNISSDAITVKTDSGEIHQAQVPSTTALKRVEPGQTDLSKAETIEFHTLAVGDRVLVNVESSAANANATRVVVMKQSDVAKVQQAQTEAWNQGVHGLVKSVDAAAGVVIVNVRNGADTKAVTVNTTKSTVIKRYAPGSVRFDQAQPAPIDTIRPNDQLWARGTKTADGSAIAADGIVSGSFRSIAGTILSSDTAGSTLSVKDLATKKPVTIRISSDAQLRKLDTTVATMLAARLKGEAQGGQFAGGAAGRQMPFGGGAGGGMPAHGPNGTAAFGNARMDPETALEKAPEIHLSALNKGDAVMIVAIDDASGVNAIKLLSGVEPLLEAPEAKNLLSSWSLGGGEESAQ